MKSKVVFKVKGLTGKDLYRKLFDMNLELEKFTANACIVTIFANSNE